jgi:hypothetical protein
MSAINNGIRRWAREEGLSAANATLIDGLTSSALATQAGAMPLTGSLHRVTKAASTASFILNPMTDRDTPRKLIVINDAANSINVYPFVGDTMNGVANAALAIAAGATGIFVNTREYISAGTETLDWRAGVIT